MNRKKLLAPALLAAMGLAAAGSLVVADPAKETKPAAGQAEMKLPPGWTPADMQACMLAGTPGKMQEYLAQGAGVWQGKSTMWMAPDTEPMSSTCTTTAKPFMDGRYVRVEMSGEMPGMGPYNGFGVYGFDNVTQKFVATWIDNHSTGIMNAIGELSSDGKTLTYVYNYTCPVTKKPTTMREVQTITGSNTKTLEMFAIEPKSGKEFKMMKIEYTKQ